MKSYTHITDTYYIIYNTEGKLVYFGVGKSGCVTSYSDDYTIATGTKDECIALLMEDGIDTFTVPVETPDTDYPKWKCEAVYADDVVRYEAGNAIIDTTQIGWKEITDKTVITNNKIKTLRWGYENVMGQFVYLDPKRYQIRVRVSETAIVDAIFKQYADLAAYRGFPRWEYKAGYTECYFTHLSPKYLTGLTTLKQAKSWSELDLSIEIFESM